MTTKHFWSNNSGDTLIEVIIATVIMGIVLFSAYTLSNQAFKLGRSARERSQATQLIQEQAEGLRALRDNAASWTSFRTLVQSQGANFHLERPAGQWTIDNNNPPPEGWNPKNTNSELPNFYHVNITGNFSGSGEDQLKVTIKVDWERFGGGPTETSTLYYHLTDRQITIPGN